MIGIANKCAKHGSNLKPAKGVPLRAILRHIMKRQEALPPVQVRQKHYSAQGESLELAEIETDINEATLQYGE